MKVKRKLIIPIVILIMVVVVILVLTNTSILNKIKGSVAESLSEEKNKSMCATEEVSDSYIKITGTIDQDYGEDGIAIITFTKDNEVYTKEIEVKTNEKSKMDFTLAKGEYNITISKEGYNVYEEKVNATKKLNITLHNSNVGDILASGQVGDNVYYNYYSNGLLQFKGTGDMWDGFDANGNVINYNGFILNDVLINQIKKKIELNDEKKVFISEVYLGQVIGNFSSEYEEMLIRSKNGLENGTCPNENNSDCDLVTALISCFSVDEIKIIIDVIMNTPVNNKVVINDGITSLGSFSLGYTKSNELIIPDSVISYGSFSLGGSSIQKLTLSKKAKRVTKEFGCQTMIKELIIPYGVEIIEDNAFSDGSLSNVIIPSSVREIDEYAFSDNELKSITIPGSVKKIGDRSFSNNKIENLILKEGIEIIEDGAFQHNNIKDLIIPRSVNKIGSLAFTETGIVNLTINGNLKEIGTGAFEENKIKELILNDGLEKIGHRAFESNEIETLIIPNTVKEIGNNAFKKNFISYLKYDTDAFNVKNLLWSTTLIDENKSDSLEIVIGDHVTYVENGLFQNQTQITKVDFGKGIKKIGSNSFRGNNITELIIPSNVEEIDDYAFAYNQISNIKINSNSNLNVINKGVFYSNNITDLTIPSTVESIKNHAFENNNLKNITIEGDKTRFNNTWIDIGFPTELMPN